jgi:hypothetical protein
VGCADAPGAGAGSPLRRPRGKHAPFASDEYSNLEYSRAFIPVWNIAPQSLQFGTFADIYSTLEYRADAKTPLVQQRQLSTRASRPSSHTVQRSVLTTRVAIRAHRYRMRDTIARGALLAQSLLMLSHSRDGSSRCRSNRVRRPARRLAVLIGALTASSCGSSESPGTEHVVRLSNPSLSIELTSDLLAPKDVDSVRVVTTWPTGPGTTTFESELGPSLPLPARLSTVYSSSGDETVRVEVTAWKGATPFTVVRAFARAPVTGSAAVRLSISWLCAATATEVAPGQIASTCPEGQSCRAGACVSDDRSGEVLPAPIPSGVKLPCFDAATCMANARSVLVDRATCTIAKPTGFVPSNLAVVKPPQTTGACTSSRCLVVLNPDPIEGWSDDGTAFAIPPAVCAALDDGRALEVIMSDTCATKPAAASTCDDASAPQ